VHIVHTFSLDSIAYEGSDLLCITIIGTIQESELSRFFWPHASTDNHIGPLQNIPG
jgi:hypothetical protein